MLDQLHFITLRSINEGDDRAGRGVMRAVAEGIALGCGHLGKILQIRDLESEMGQISPHYHGTAGVVLAELDLLVTSGSLQKDQLGTASALASADFLQAQHIAVKGNGLFEILNAITGV